MHATKAAVEEGIVPGGGVALVRCIPALQKLKAEGDEQIGINIVKRALEEPLRMIAQNAGHEGAVVVEKVKSNSSPNYGFNAQTEAFGDLVNEGVIDPTKVTRVALQNGRLDCFPAPHHRGVGQRVPRRGKSDSRRIAGRHGRRDVLRGSRRQPSTSQ